MKTLKNQNISKAVHKPKFRSDQKEAPQSSLNNEPTNSGAEIKRGTPG